MEMFFAHGFFWSH